MESKNYTEVYIAGKVYTLGGFEEEEYLQKIAAYVNAKVNELRGQQGYLKLSADYQNVLLELNLADDVFKTKRQVAAAERKLSAQEKETYHVKHDMVAAQMKLDAMNGELEALRQELENTKKELETTKSELDVAKDALEEATKRISQREDRNRNRRY